MSHTTQKLGGPAARFVYSRRFAGVLGGLALASGFALSAAEDASAATAMGPSSCVETSYFKEAAHTHQVGLRTTCPGGAQWGTTSRYYEREVITDDTPSGPSHDGPGDLPCEFMQSGCANYPTPRG